MADTATPDGTIALTGASGFVGRHVARRLRAAGWHVRALLRRPVPELEAIGVESVAGSLESSEALHAVVRGAAWVVHVAGAVRAASREAFHAANAAGTARLAEASVSAAPGARFLLVSSLAARAPSLSPYAASKRRGELEVAVRARALRPIVVRPPAVYGPGDRATLPLVAQLAGGWLVAPRAPGSRFSLLYVEDLAELVADLVEAPPETAAAIEPDDRRPGGYAWHDLAAIAGAAIGRRVRVVAVPRPVLEGAALLAQLGARPFGRSPVLSRGKVAELFHPHWLADSASAAALPQPPRVTFADGFLRTLAWYRKHGWL